MSSTWSTARSIWRSLYPRAPSWLRPASSRTREEVLPTTIRERLAQAVGSDDVVHVVTEDDFGPGKATLGRAGRNAYLAVPRRGRSRYRVRVQRSPICGDATSGLVDEQTGRRTAVHTLFRPTANNWVDSARMAKAAVETFSRNGLPVYLSAHHQHRGAGRWDGISDDSVRAEFWYRGLHATRDRPRDRSRMVPDDGWFG